MRQGISPALTAPARGAGMEAEMTPGIAQEDVWI
jgi:hypothetical protein